MTPISKDAAIARIHAAGLTIADAIAMSDDALLRLPSIGRRTLRFIRAFPVL
jgi:hypothetical protein